MNMNIRNLLAGSALTVALVGGGAALAPPASAALATVSHPGGGTGVISASAPFAAVICASTLSNGTTTSVAAFNSSGVLIGQVIDGAANGVSVCKSFANTTVYSVTAKVEKQSKPNCYRRYKSSRFQSFASWSLIGSNFIC
jgi:hypothetical protein